MLRMRTTAPDGAVGTDPIGDQRQIHAVLQRHHDRVIGHMIRHRIQNILGPLRPHRDHNQIELSRQLARKENLRLNRERIVWQIDAQAGASHRFDMLPVDIAKCQIMTGTHQPPADNPADLPGAH